MPARNGHRNLAAELQGRAAWRGFDHLPTRTYLKIRAEVEILNYLYLYSWVLQ